MIAILLVSTLCSFAQADTAFAKRSFIKDNYKIDYPNTWQADTSGIMCTALIIFSPLENETDKFSENINIMEQSLDGQNIDLEKYKQITDKHMVELATDYRAFESIIIKEDKKEYFRITYGMTQGKLKLKITSVCFIKSEKAYLITYTAEFDKYDQYKTTAERILRSFSFLR